MFTFLAVLTHWAAIISAVVVNFMIFFTLILFPRVIHGQLEFKARIHNIPFILVDTMTSLLGNQQLDWWLGSLRLTRRRRATNLFVKIFLGISLTVTHRRTETISNAY